MSLNNYAGKRKLVKELGELYRYYFSDLKDIELKKYKL